MLRDLQYSAAPGSAAKPPGRHSDPRDDGSHTRQPRGSKRRKIVLALLAAVLLFVALRVLSSPPEASPAVDAETVAMLEDAIIFTGCQVVTTDSISTLETQVSFTSPFFETKESYTVGVAFMDGNDLVGVGVARFRNLGVGETQSFTVGSAPLSVGEYENLTCAVRSGQ